MRGMFILAGTKEFLEQFSSITFDERPFCDGDAVALCEITYIHYEDIVSPSFDDEPVSFAETSRKLMEIDEKRVRNLGLMISPNLGKRMMAMANGKRYADVKIAAFRRFYSVTPAVQFVAGTFILPDGTVVVSYQGTDDTLAGWKEDLDFFVHRTSPSYQYAIDYINEVSEKFDGEIILIGHSKGGHEALYTALKCSPAIRKRIKYLYNNDGPGFYDYSIFRTGAYDELADRYRHFVPSSSFVGMLLAHDYDYKAVKSTRHLGPLQHDLETWQIADGDLVVVPDTDILSKITDVFLAKLINRADDKSIEALDKVIGDLFIGSGQETITGFAKNALSAVKGAKSAWDEIEPDVRDSFKNAFSGAGKLIKESIDVVKSKDVKEEIKNAFSFAKVV